jgi:hypothetical protein
LDHFDTLTQMAGDCDQIKNSTLGKARMASKWQFWMHFVANWDT